MNCNGTAATTFLQLNQEHLTQPGMKLFPNYTPPIPPHNDSSPAANHHYHQITYQQPHPHTQTLAPLRLNQDHFSKTNTLGGAPNGRPKYQTHHHHHHIQSHPADLQQQPDSDPDQHPDEDVLEDDHEEDSCGSVASVPTVSPTPPELPIRNGLTQAGTAAYAVNTLNHINNNTLRGPETLGVTGTGTVGGGRKTMRHYH